jgi:2-polyprenyl-3-methyl-5-hydroxy-6-metoxy-1,4-benzoquinol methylase
MPPHAAVLDIGCQHGRFTLPLLNAEYNVTATDIKQKFLDSIKANAPAGAILTLRKENIDTTVANKTGDKYDVIFCLELLYLMPDFQNIIGKLAEMLHPGGILVTSHRTKGYYNYRFAHEQNEKAAQQILENVHPHFNAQTPDQILSIFSSNKMNVLSQQGIGMLSGFDRDPFTHIANPAKMNAEELNTLFAQETNAITQHLFINNARYLLVVSQKPN